jgi:hypothetical protein
MIFDIVKKIVDALDKITFVSDMYQNSQNSSDRDRSLEKLIQACDEFKRNPSEENREAVRRASDTFDWQNSRFGGGLAGSVYPGTGGPATDTLDRGSELYDPLSRGGDTFRKMTEKYGLSREDQICKKYQDAKGWTQPVDPLVLDLDGDGVETVGIGGYGNTVLFDHDGDGVFDANDSAFNDVRVWQDKNQDGVSQADTAYSGANIMNAAKWNS